MRLAAGQDIIWGGGRQVASVGRCSRRGGSGGGEQCAGPSTCKLRPDVLPSRCDRLVTTHRIDAAASPRPRPKSRLRPRPRSRPWLGQKAYRPETRLIRLFGTPRPIRSGRGSREGQTISWSPFVEDTAANPKRCVSSNDSVNSLITAWARQPEYLFFLFWQSPWLAVEVGILCGWGTSAPRKGNYRKTVRRFALGASNLYLIVERPTCFVLAFW